MKPIHLQRLRKLARFLRKVPPEKFDLSIWSATEPPTRKDCQCNTSACAVGWATVLFKEEGFHLACQHRMSMTFEPTYKNKVSWAAVTSFFGLTTSQAHFLFMEPHYRPKPEIETDDWEEEVDPVSPAEVADRISEFILMKSRSLRSLR